MDRPLVSKLQGKTWGNMLSRTLIGMRNSCRDFLWNLLGSLSRINSEIPWRISLHILSKILAWILALVPLWSSTVFFFFLLKISESCLAKDFTRVPPWISTRVFHRMPAAVPPGISSKRFSDMLPEFLAGFPSEILPKLIQSFFWSFC